ncbi:MAG TPA: hypothetical protein VMT74_05675 [Gaiellaceae bacterium]|nr:hypothetical protein [Gaiellaceae bacterium]
MRSMLAVVVVLAGVSTLAASSGAAAASQPLPLRARVLQAGELAGFRPDHGLARYPSAALWVQSDPTLSPAQRAAEVARLRREGFKGLAQQFYAHGTTQEGVSWVMQLGSAAAARAELATSFDKYRTQDIAMGARFTPYAVAAIPGARGYGLRGGGQAGENVFFADGPFLYLVGVGWPTAGAHPPTRAGLIAAATRLYKRVHGHPAG